MNAVCPPFPFIIHSNAINRPSSPPDGDSSHPHKNVFWALISKNSFQIHFMTILSQDGKEAEELLESVMFKTENQ